jgi:hypothetical protein
LAGDEASDIYVATCMTYFFILLECRSAAGRTFRVFGSGFLAPNDCMENGESYRSKECIIVSEKISGLRLFAPGSMIA